MHRSTPSPELLDACLPPRVGRNARLERLPQLIDWGPLEALVADLHAAPLGRPSYPPLLVVKVLLLQQWCQTSDPAVEEALWERLSFRRFVGLGCRTRRITRRSAAFAHSWRRRAWPSGCSR
jgi:hypothetical protein